MDTEPHERGGGRPTGFVRAKKGEKPLPSTSSPEFRTAFQRRLRFDVRTAVILLTAFSLVRAIVVLLASMTGQFLWVGIVFTVMIALPWILLTRRGRQRIGLVKPTRSRWMLPAALVGAAVCLIGYVLFSALWGDSPKNAFVYIGETYPPIPSGIDPAIYYVGLAAAVASMGPIGDELLYRGVAQESFTAKLGGSNAALIVAGAFAAVHLAHFGVVYVNGAWHFIAGPAALWLFVMFAGALIFHWFRMLTGSIWGAIASHVGFTLTLTVVTFSLF